MRRIHSLLSLLVLSLIALAARGQDGAVEKPRLAIRDIAPTQPVLDAARVQGQGDSLRQILAAADSQLIDAVTATRRFDIVARADLVTVLKEQDIAESGLIDPSDPQTARAFSMAGARYVATITVENFQEGVATAQFQGGLGETTMERRTVQLQATLKIYDTTSGVLLDSASLVIEDAEVRETLPGATQTGRLTNALLGTVATHLARDTANAIMDTLAPAKVLAYTMGQVTLNRGEGTGVAVGQVWQVFHAGQALVDPDTGEVLGSEEIPVGWVRITEVTPKFSKAQAIEDMGIVNGSILRFSPLGLPAHIDPNARPGGSARPGASAPSRPVSAPAAERSAPSAGGSDLRSASGPARRLAVFVRDVSPEVDDRYTDVLETLVTASVGGAGVEIISRALVLNAVSELSSAGANRGGDDGYAEAAARLLSDQASAASLARTLGADGLLVATIADLSENERHFNDPDLGVRTEITQTTLTLTWDVIAGDTGGSLASGLADATTRVRQSTNVQSSPADIGELLKQAARQVGFEARRAILDDATRAAQAAEGEVAVRISVSMQDLSVPEIRKVDGAWVVTADRYLLQPAACDVLIDGFQVGSAPGSVYLSPGPHRMRIERPGLEPVDRFIVARDGMELTIPMQLSEEGRVRWMQHAAFLESLKDGTSLREDQSKIAEGVAEFLRNARINLDTSNLQSVDTNSFWFERFGR